MRERRCDKSWGNFQNAATKNGDIFSVGAVGVMCKDRENHRSGCILCLPTKRTVEPQQGVLGKSPGDSSHNDIDKQRHPTAHVALRRVIFRAKKNSLDQDVDIDHCLHTANPSSDITVGLRTRIIAMYFSTAISYIPDVLLEVKS